MAARRAWVVFIDDSRQLEQDQDINGMWKTNTFEPSRRYLSVFFREAQATEAAKYLANQHPGKDVHVLKQIFGYCSQAKPVEYKEWTEDGTFLPVSK